MKNEILVVCPFETENHEKTSILGKCYKCKKKIWIPADYPKAKKICKVCNCKRDPDALLEKTPFGKIIMRISG